MKPDYMKYDGRTEEPPYQTEADEVSESELSDLLCVKPPRTIGSAHAPFSLKENPEYVDWCEARINQLETALKQIEAIKWGYDGDCGAQRIIDSVLDA